MSPNPKDLIYCSDPIGEDNNYFLQKNLSYWSENLNCDLWLGWGVKGVIKNRNIEIIDMVKFFSIKRLESSSHALAPLAIGSTKDGHPMHPLYVSRLKNLQSFDLTS